eukprot:snap_masked-scaffold_22-processed-gene-3.15-mRNA-1 protein AED:1.00 eAED:1.00 QI:0/-1/0/0/-1/1/1/0/377
MELRKQIVLSCFTADAANMPLHWFYDTNKLRELLKDETRSNGILAEPEFYAVNSCPYYNGSSEDKEKGFPGHYGKGMNSPNGETGMVMLEYLKSTGGKYEGGESLARFQFDWFNAYTGRKDHPTKTMEDNIKKFKEEKKVSFYPDCGADDAQTYFAFKIPQIFLKFGGEDEARYSEIVEESIRTLQNNDQAVACGKTHALLLKKCAEGSSFESALQHILNLDDAVLDSTADKTFAKLIKTSIEFGLNNAEALSEAEFDKNLGFESTGFGQKLVEQYGIPEDKKFMALSCGTPQAFAVSIKFILDAVRTFGAGTDAFKTKALPFVVRRNILFGGDNCGRNWMIASLATALGAEIPNYFKEKYVNTAKIEALIEEISSF